MAVVDLTQTALAALRRGQNYFRIRESYNEADSYNIDVSLAAVCIGPDSDVDSIGLTYIDFGVAGLTRTLQVGVGSPWTAGIEARMDQTLPGSTTPGRINIGIGSYARHVDTDYTTPILDFICYFKPPGALPSIRPPKWQQSKLFTSAGVGTAEQVVFTQAYYGRRRASLTMYNPDGTKTLTAWRFVGVLVDGSDVNIEHNISPASGSTNTLAAGATASYVLTDARFDYIQFLVTPSAVSTPLRYSWEISDT